MTERPTVDQLERIIAEQANLLDYEEGRSFFIAALRRVLKVGGPSAAVAVARAALDDLRRTEPDRWRWLDQARAGDERERAREELDLAARVRRLLDDWVRTMTAEHAAAMQEQEQREQRVAKAVAALERSGVDGVRLALGLLRR